MHGKFFLRGRDVRMWLAPFCSLVLIVSISRYAIQSLAIQFALVCLALTASRIRIELERECSNQLFNSVWHEMFVSPLKQSVLWTTIDVFHLWRHFLLAHKTSASTSKSTAFYNGKPFSKHWQMSSPDQDHHH
jgi:hypothetical protein